MEPRWEAGGGRLSRTGQAGGQGLLIQGEPGGNLGHVTGRWHPGASLGQGLDSNEGLPWPLPSSASPRGAALPPGPL